MRAGLSRTGRRLALVEVCLFAGFFVSASWVSAQRLPLKPYTVADGLPNNVINKIVRDSRGFLWFCTGEGLSRFDGYSFTNFGVDQGLPHAIVNVGIRMGAMVCEGRRFVKNVTSWTRA